MTHTKMLKWAINGYVMCALLAFLATAFSGGYSDNQLAPRVWIFPLRFEFALALLFLSLLASYSLLFNSLHGRLLLVAIAVVHILNMIFTSTLVESSLAAMFSTASMLSLGVLLYIAWTDPLQDKVKRLRAYQQQRLYEKQQQDKIDYAYLHTALNKELPHHQDNSHKHSS
ncbi:hypothetical protein [Agarivorans gilvus]|uniref:Uncharacterized protein n=1 Tax=Agarivorans gilvus TaxID=680279 RepID=A0ABQ1I4M4_9ALTE|nr:hypothetical protein [Agarivorans gilvus]GGB13671.1 hypothetical protein GCM10007414_28840 [Agarivorans gilvus]